ncbi:beta-glucosidase 24-like [Rutidosis leptorrhynchoides]|uniref:beta-glucosidase 24-like n=1 Tax=Rutidosis leptorrhynchoides TaxID=125765 RepID=UPI003A991987
MAVVNINDHINHDYDLDPNPVPKHSDFPRHFMFGVGTSAYQIEGAWNADRKGLSIWDCFALRRPEKIFDRSNACVAVDNYARMKEDVQLLKNMGVKHFRFSISWPRILPGGKVSMGKNMEGIDHYNKLIDELLANGIEPFVTLFHWDLPNALEEEYMGFLSSKIVDDFVNYAEICFWEFGDRVKNWLTLNEPHRFTESGYVSGMMAPGRGGDKDDGDAATEPYIVAYNLLNCHAAAYRKYQEDYKDVQKGKVGITVDINYFKPWRGPNNADDVKAVGYAFDFMAGWFLEPLASGEWPESMKTFATSPTPNHPKGRVLPKFSDDQRSKLIGSYDFMGINYYTATYAASYEGYYGTSPPKVPWGYTMDTHYVPLAKDPQGNFIGPPAFEGSWVYLCAKELTDLLIYVKKTYKIEKHFVITENGANQNNVPEQTYEQVRDDEFRLKYIKWHLKAILDANREGVNVMGYFAWSFMDSYEWFFGHTSRFGMIYVDYANNLQRYPKKSAIWFKKFLAEGHHHHGHKKRLAAKANVEQEDDDLNGTMIEADDAVEADQPVETVQKMKKAKA